MTTDTDTDDDYEPQTAMMLTQQEWEDLAVMMTIYLNRTDGVNEANENMFADIARRRALANRIIEAV
jgi:hypothetical protein